MFKKALRLSPSVSLKKARVQSCTYFILKYVNNDLNHNRYGFIISKKTAKQAVVRNKTKRLLRGKIERLEPRLKKGFDILFIIKKAAVDSMQESIDTKLHEMLSNEQLIT
jgi:ribonuclease P protein component